MSIKTLKRFIMSPNTIARRLKCKYPTNLWKNVDGVITCPACGDTLTVIYIWQMIIMILWLLDICVIYVA